MPTDAEVEVAVEAMRHVLIDRGVQLPALARAALEAAERVRELEYIRQRQKYESPVRLDGADDGR